MLTNQEFFSAVLKGDINTIRKAIDNKFNIDTQIEGSRHTALHMAISKCNLELVQWLLLNNANCNIGNRDGITPLEAAALCTGFDCNQEKFEIYTRIIILLLKKSIEDKVDNSGDKIAAIKVLSRKKDFTEEEISLFIGILDDTDCKVRVAAVEAMGNQNFLSLQDMVFFDKAMHDGEGAVRNTVIHTLGKQNPLSLKALEVLCLALADPQSSIRIATIKIFGNQLKVLGNEVPVSREILNALIAVLDKQDLHLLIAAVEAVANQHPPSAEALAFYYKAIHHSQSGVRHAAVKALGEQDPLSREAIAILRQAATDQEPSIRTAVNALLNAQKENIPTKTLWGSMPNIGLWFSPSEKAKEEEIPLLPKGIKPKQE